MSRQQQCMDSWCDSPAVYVVQRAHVPGTSPRKQEAVCSVHLELTLIFDVDWCDRMEDGKRPTWTVRSIIDNDPVQLAAMRQRQAQRFGVRRQAEATTDESRKVEQ